MIRAYSERLHPVNNDHMFHVTIEEDQQHIIDDEEDNNPMMLEEDAHSMSKDIQAHLREHLYGNTHEQVDRNPQERDEKNIIVDDDDEVEEYVDDEDQWMMCMCNVF